MNILQEITARKRQEIELLKITVPVSMIMESDTGDKRQVFKQSLSDKNHINIIAELKKASPSRGIISSNFDPKELAQDYQRGGAVALSVLTESHFFKGRHEYLEIVKQETGLPVLCKDFIIDPYQIYYARYMKADAVLLIVALHSKESFSDLLATARQTGLDTLVEVHNHKELQIALDCGADIIGVNNRNLKDFSVSLHTAEKLSDDIPLDVTRVAESGIHKYEDILRLKKSGFNTFLIGEALMKADDPVQLLNTLRGV